MNSFTKAQSCMDGNKILDFNPSEAFQVLKKSGNKDELTELANIIKEDDISTTDNFEKDNNNSDK